MDRTGARGARLATLTACMLPLASCTTIASGIATRPAGVNEHSFRECLVANGFFTDHALTGLSREEYIDRRARKDAPPPPPLAPAEIDRMGDAEFALRSAKIIREGLFPYLQYDEGMAERDSSFSAAIAEVAYNRPYMVVREGVGAERAGTGAEPPPPGEPPRPDLPINRYLDCYVGPVGLEGEPLSSSGDSDIEGRLLRAHVALTMLAAFGTELVTSRASKRQPEQATRLLGHVRDAELSLRAASAVMNPALRRFAVQQGWVHVVPPLPTEPKRAPRKGAAAKAAQAARDKAVQDAIDHAPAIDVPRDVGGATPLLRWHAYATRLLRVFQIGVDVEAIDAEQSLNRLTTIIAAFAQPTPGAFEGILKDALKGLGTVQKVQLYGEAMGRDGRETLAEHRLALEPGAVIPREGRGIPSWRYDTAKTAWRWQAWDARLEEACRVLANVAKQTPSGCVPTPGGMAEALAAELPPMPAPAPKPAGAE